jgi:hypothetical protein
MLISCSPCFSTKLDKSFSHKTSPVGARRSLFTKLNIVLFFSQETQKIKPAPFFIYPIKYPIVSNYKLTSAVYWIKMDIKMYIFNLDRSQKAESI